MCLSPQDCLSGCTWLARIRLLSAFGAASDIDRRAALLYIWASTIVYTYIYIQQLYTSLLHVHIYSKSEAQSRLLWVSETEGQGNREGTKHLCDGDDRGKTKRKQDSGRSAIVLCYTEGWFSPPPYFSYIPSSMPSKPSKLSHYSTLGSRRFGVPTCGCSFSFPFFLFYIYLTLCIATDLPPVLLHQRAKVCLLPGSSHSGCRRLRHGNPDDPFSHPTSFSEPQESSREKPVAAIRTSVIDICVYVYTHILYIYI